MISESVPGLLERSGWRREAGGGRFWSLRARRPATTTPGSAFERATHDSKWAGDYDAGQCVARSWGAAEMPQTTYCRAWLIMIGVRRPATARAVSIGRFGRISTILQVKRKAGMDETRQHCALSATQGWNGLQ